METNLPEIRSTRAAENGDDTKEPCAINEVEKRRCKIRAAFASLEVSEKEFWINQAVETLSRIDTRSSDIVSARFLDEPRGRGRPIENRNYAVTSIVGYYYKMVTGRLPARFHNAHLDSAWVQGENRHGAHRAGTFVALLYKVFEVLQLKVSADHLTRTVAQDFKRAKKAQDGE